MKFEIVQSLDEALWQQFLLENPKANIFQSPEFSEIFRRVKGHTPHLWAALNNDGAVKALLPTVEVTLIDGLLSRLTTRLIAYGGVLYDSSPDGHEALSQLLEIYTQRVGRAALFTEFRNLFDVTDVQPILKNHDFKFEGHLNYLIDLDRPAEEILQSMGRRTRKQIRRGLRQGDVTISEVSHREQLDDWYKLLQRTYSVAQVPLSDISLFEAAFDVLHPKGMIKFLIANVDDTMVSCSAELLFKDIIYGWYGGTDREYSSYIPNELLIWHLLEWGAENGYRVYDFGGAGKPDEEYGVRDFKAKFGGELVNFGRNTHVHSPSRLKLSKFSYGLYRKIL
ncbi:MAG: GNAT family N-acetyltransferase [Chloroflexota bacterium]|nr:GNAT family N-acetyltransferase [Chloroflexota bacterium]